MLLNQFNFLDFGLGCSVKELVTNCLTLVRVIDGKIVQKMIPGETKIILGPR